jgi:hydroxymethylbilane synthase
LHKKFIVGSRGSLLALTQCNQILKELTDKTGAQFHIEIIKTQGDLNTSIPLWQMEGENFFTKELDQALLTKKVDFVVHSYKDLGSKRPEGITIGAITKRYFAQDILLVSKNAMTNWEDKEEFLVGTSSPRRCANIEHHLNKFLPFNNVRVKTSPLRGNVNTRIEKLIEGQYDAIVLALAGLERLANNEESKKVLDKLLENLDYMVLPQSYFPSSASQGALALECLERNEEILDLLKNVHHNNTSEEVKRERKIFNEFGGGCHLSVGINVRKTELGFMNFIEGTFEEKRINNSVFEGLDEVHVEFPLFIGLPKDKSEIRSDVIYDELLIKHPCDSPHKLESSNLFVSSSYCFDYILKNYKDQSLWAAGAKTMMGLAKLGYWVNGSSDSFGEDELLHLRNSALLKIMNKQIDSPWNVLTHKSSKTVLGKIIDCYDRKIDVVSTEFEQSLNKTASFFWTSAKQYQVYTDKYPFIKERKHYCGLGKTFKALKEEGVNVKPIFNLNLILKGNQNANTDRNV